MTIVLDPAVSTNARLSPELDRRANCGAIAVPTARASESDRGNDCGQTKEPTVAEKPHGLGAGESQLDRIVYAVRLDRPDGTHHVVGPDIDRQTAEERQGREKRDWAAAGLWAPDASVVTMTGAAFLDHARHQRSCTSPDCPTNTGHDRPIQAPAASATHPRMRGDG